VKQNGNRAKANGNRVKQNGNGAKANGNRVKQNGNGAKQNRSRAKQNGNGAKQNRSREQRVERDLGKLMVRLERERATSPEGISESWLADVAARLGLIAADLRTDADGPTVSEQRLRDIVEVRQPLLLITQIQRSGGTLLSQLLDGHPEVHAHPHELHIGHPKKTNWAAIDPEDTWEAWFETLFEPPIERFVEHGYRKEFRPGTEASRLPFVFSVSLQREIFKRCAEPWGEVGPRGAFDAYMTSYFNAWLDNHNLYGTKRWITGFVPVLGMEPRNVEQYFETYPDGQLISIVRDPRTWYASAHGHFGKRAKQEFGNVEIGVDNWTRSIRAGLAAREKYGADRVLLTLFEDLVRNTEPTMRVIADRLGIGFSQSLLEPSFNGMPIAPNSSFGLTGPGVHAAAADPPNGRLSQDDADYLATEAQPLYEHCREELRVT
jgi:hypothetical protein